MDYEFTNKAKYSSPITKKKDKEKVLHQEKPKKKVIVLSDEESRCSKEEVSNYFNKELFDSEMFELTSLITRTSFSEKKRCKNRTLFLNAVELYKDDINLFYEVDSTGKNFIIQLACYEKIDDQDLRLELLREFLQPEYCFDLNHKDNNGWNVLFHIVHQEKFTNRFIYELFEEILSVEPIEDAYSPIYFNILSEDEEGNNIFHHIKNSTHIKDDYKNKLYALISSY